MPLTLDALEDFVNLTISNFKRSKWTDISLEHQEYVAARLIDSKKVMEVGGPDIRFKVQTKNSNTARNTGVYAQDVTNVEGNLTTEGRVDWSMQTVNWSYDLAEEVFQTDRETIVRELVIREHAAHNSMTELDEDNLWTSPTSTSDKRPKGIPYWFVKDATTTAEGAFNGGNPTGFSAGAADIDSTVYPRWRNWTFGYSQVTADDLVRKVKKSLVFTNFMAPHPHPELGYGKSERVIYTTYRVLEPLQRLAESRNDNLGNDVARYMNSILIGGVPVEMVFYLEANDTTDPLYGINWKYMRPYCKKGWHMLRHPPKQAAKQHTVREVHIDNSMNYACLNRRAMWVGSKS